MPVCVCTTHCNGSKDVSERTWRLHRPYRLQTESYEDFLSQCRHLGIDPGDSNPPDGPVQPRKPLVQRAKRTRKRRRTAVDENEDAQEARSAQPDSAPDAAEEEPAIRVTREDIKNTYEYIELLKNATLEESGITPRQLERLKNPPQEAFEIKDADTLLSIKIFMAIGNASQETYNAVADAIKEHSPHIEMMSLAQVNSTLDKLTGVLEVRDDMCVNSCLAYTGPFQDLQECPYCQEPRYKPLGDDEDDDPSKPRVPRERVTTFLPGPVIQGFWRSADTADEMMYLWHAAQDLIAKTPEGTAPKSYTDAFRKGDIGPCDTLLSFSIDGAQLYRNKDSDCWISIWLVENLSPDKRFKKRFILPGCVIPGPNHPVNLDSFIFRGLYHVSALMREGLPIWNGRTGTKEVSKFYVPAHLADGPAMALLDGTVGHQGALGCRCYCGLPGRHKPGAGCYYPVLNKPVGPDIPGSDHRDIKLSEIRLPSPKVYKTNIRTLAQAENQNRYEQLRKATGLCKPSLFSGLCRTLPLPLSCPLDLMHLTCHNLCTLLIEIWRGVIKGGKTDATTYRFAVLTDEEWPEHGLEVEFARSFLPGFFDRTPRNIALKWNSGYKAIEMQTYLYVYAPNMMRRRLPADHWGHLCKTVRAVRNVSEYEITEANLIQSRELLNSATEDFEKYYYERDPDRLHFVRPVIHHLWHIPDQIVLNGSLIVRTQLPMERMIGQFGGELKQPSNPYANLSQRAARRMKINTAQGMMPSLDRAEQRALGIPRGAEPIGDNYIFLQALERSRSSVRPAEARAFFDYFARTDPGVVEGANRWTYSMALRRWARIRLPNGQVARCAWKENRKALCRLRMARCVKFEGACGRIEVGEVRFFHITECADCPVALVSVFGPWNEELYEQSSEVIELMEYRGDSALRVIDVKCIRSVVGMVPDVRVSRDVWLHDHQHLHEGKLYVVSEKMGFEVRMGSRDPELDIDE
ncbi:hypothetical protein OH76DRAFT_1459464 [Lentinus brumalis]|uniref:Uncharacterized protein n=1 Tax=Lentinus brumalis TaxID=2498619 RepID=A0A371CK11_9APHY|nr:hypothetical protein OH76DRAFT_1459464 [Polyporus brumalis]